MTTTAPGATSPSQEAVPTRTGRAGTTSAVGSPAKPAGPASVRRGRLEFLDALRGVAALAVALQHGAELLWPAYLRWSVEVFRPGEFGVFVFFLCSGFIIPASLERYGSLRRFWVGRFFRLFPLFWAALFLVVVGHHYLHDYPMPASGGAAWWDVAANVTMMQNMIGQPPIIGVSWTLTYEMTFYLLCSVLFLLRLQKRSVPSALWFLVGALMVGEVFPVRALVDNPGRQVLALAVFGALAAGLVVWVRGRGTSPERLIFGLVAAGLVVLFLNRDVPLWFAAMLLGTMFSGTVLYRWHAGELSGRVAGGVTALALFVGVFGAFLYVPTMRNADLANALHTWRPESLTYAAALGLFVLALALRSHRYPRILTFLGKISYSVYLGHALVIYMVPHWGDHKWLTYGRWMVAVLVVATLTYYLVEKPFMDFGHRLARRGLPSKSDAPVAAGARG